MVMESGALINESEDWTFQKQCGCLVTFTGESLHKRARMQWCSWHCRRGKAAFRIKIMDEAEESLRLAKQPTKVNA